LQRTLCTMVTQTIRNARHTYQHLTQENHQKHTLLSDTPTLLSKTWQRLHATLHKNPRIKTTASAHST
ncbi:hypothetical protein ACFMJ4_19900, partial [Acinetobacter baumannii]